MTLMISNYIATYPCWIKVLNHSNVRVTLADEDYRVCWSQHRQEEARLVRLAGVLIILVAQDRDIGNGVVYSDL